MRRKIMRQRARRLKERFDARAGQVTRVRQACANDEYDGLFTSDHIIQSSGFVDFFFVGKYHGKDVVFNACMTTADSDYYDTIESIAFDEINCPASMPSIFSSRNTPEQEKTVFDHYRAHSEFILDVMRERRISIPAWQVEMDFAYKFGIGLHIRIDKPAIEVDDIVDFIHAFHKQGTQVFAHKAQVINKTPEELGISLADDDMFIRWERGEPNIAELNF